MIPTNLLTALPPCDPTSSERVDQLLSRPGVRVERIVSSGQASPPGFWYDQAEGEWIVLLSGAAGLRFEHESHTRLPGAGRLPGHPAALPPPRGMDRPRHRHHLARGVLQQRRTVANMKRWLPVGAALCCEGASPADTPAALVAASSQHKAAPTQSTPPTFTLEQSLSARYMNQHEHLIRCNFKRMI
ncbi:cupin [Pseudomonas putida S11]|nr:cupin [Pseudomonas putida S11]